MKIVFLGVGESTALDTNTSILIEGKTNLLLDCGYSVPPRLWAYNAKPDFLDAIFISHQHGDHILGLPALLLRMRQDGRKKKLSIICSPHVEGVIKNLMNTHYRDVLGNLPVDFLPAARQRFLDVRLEFAQSMHGEENYAIRISTGKKSVCYSGDGMFNEATMRLYQHADLLIHEAYTLNRKVEGHATLASLVSLFGSAGIRRLAAVHVRKDQDRNAMLAFARKTRLPIFLPKPMERVRL